jgi:serine/threonine protein kinase
MGAPVLPASDQYALGVLAYELLTGHLPYGERAVRARTPADLARLEYVPAYQHNPLVPLWMNAALRKALRGEPRLRYAEISEFVHDLSRPNPDYLNERAVPLIERNPLRFWKTLCFLLALLNVLTWAYFVSGAARRTEQGVTAPGTRR